MARVKTHEKFLQQLAEKNPKVKVLGQYEGSFIPVLVECLKCSHRWKANPAALIRGTGCPTGCPKCAGQDPETVAKKFHEFMGQHPRIILHGEYVQARNPVAVECKTCHHRWLVVPPSLLHGSDCPKCAWSRIPAEKFHIFMAQHPEIILHGEYIKAKKAVLVECKKCHHQWKANPDHLMRGGTGCPKCAGKCPEFVAKKFHEFMECHPSIVLHGKYMGWDKHVVLECKKCHHRWKANPNNLMRGKGCPNCAPYGFQPDKAGICYYVRIGNLYKIGVTNRTVAERFAWERKEVIPIHIWHFQNGNDALVFETEILEKHRAHAYVGRRIFKAGGNDELFTCDVLGLDNGAQLEFSLAA
jgi:hypothetical protein